MHCTYLLKVQAGTNNFIETWKKIVFATFLLSVCFACKISFQRVYLQDLLPIELPEAAGLQVAAGIQMTDIIPNLNLLPALNWHVVHFSSFGPSLAHFLAAMLTYVHLHVLQGNAWMSTECIQYSHGPSTISQPAGGKQKASVLDSMCAASNRGHATDHLHLMSERVKLTWRVPEKL